MWTKWIWYRKLTVVPGKPVKMEDVFYEPGRDFYADETTTLARLRAVLRETVMAEFAALPDVSPVNCLCSFSSYSFGATLRLQPTNARASAILSHTIYGPASFYFNPVEVLGLNVDSHRIDEFFDQNREFTADMFHREVAGKNLETLYLKYPDRLSETQKMLVLLALS
jgi:hypothetical protein